MSNVKGKGQRLIPEELLKYLEAFKEAHPDPTQGGGATLDDIVDSQDRKRFIEGEGVLSEVPNYTFTYNKWSLSGTHLMLVLAGTVASGGGASVGQTFAEYELPEWILNKITPLSENGIVIVANVTYYTISSGVYLNSKEILLKKTTNKLSIVNNGGGTLNNNVAFRIQLDLLIDAS